jgi:hypothetical protein
MRVKILIAVVVCVFGALQFFRPSLDNPPVVADFSGPPAISHLLRRSCYNCHSNETKLPWFDKIVPAYWQVASDVRLGRAVLNFSNWDPHQRGLLYESLNQMTFGVMPLASYRFVHRDAAIGDSDIAVFKAYLRSLPPVTIFDTARRGALERQRLAWPFFGAVLPALSGIPFPSGFDRWGIVSTTDRTDNGTMRVIFGNPVALQAIRDGHTNPWPDGTIFAKAAWASMGDSASGVIHSGAFLQVEFMIKDHRAYRATDGWGFARWVHGLQLTPYTGSSSECVRCHAPMKANDFVFTIPVRSVAPSGWSLVSSFIDTKAGTMSTLYGDSVAVAAARSGRPYPSGSGLLLATWVQREDPHWFGALIPGELKSVGAPGDSSLRASVIP